ncbi:hypothetical protein BDN70DRAFT_996278 [Pholiota conissans]|uniref:Uncharacterized protein n=1 Tax=Pholiota conissans TaxID=109636 RepID=A0A9P5YTN6_9AGAR|nr:hypothetical protein BDN70DRAFT_996278 [Pholiota conissans]
MDCSSETDSDSDGPTRTTVTGPCPLFPSPETSFSHQVIDLAVVEQEVRKLSEQQMDCDFEVSPPILAKIQVSADTLVNFVTHIPSLLLGGDTSAVLITLASLVSAVALDQLFLYRKIFRDAAITSQSVHRTTMVLTWVDELLARLHSVLLMLASGSYLNHFENMAESIQSHKREDVLRATVQLPEKWIDMHTVIGSVNFSPASKRIATTFLFGAYIVHPQLMRFDSNSWLNYCPDSDDILESLKHAITHMASQVHSPSRDIEPLPQRMMASMQIVLFSTFNSKSERHEKVYLPHLRPEESRHLLYLLQIVMVQATDSFLPVARLDIPQIILLRWGNVVPWTWSIWDDQRIANTGHLPCLTATWLYHLNEPLFANLEPFTSGNDSFRSDFRISLFADIKASSMVILQLLQHIVRALDDKGNKDAFYSVLVNLMSKLCWAIVQYLESNSLRATYVIEARISEYTKFSIVAYVILGLTPEDVFVKGLIIELLTHISPESINICIQQLLKDQTYRFLNRLGKATKTCVDTFTRNGTSADTAVEKHQILNAKALIEFLTIILSTITPEETAIHEIASPFIDELIKILHSPHEYSSLAANLRNAVLMILCVSQNARSGRFDEDVWALAIRPGVGVMITAGIFAQYLLQSGRPYGLLLRYEAWNHLLSVMVMILNREISKEEESLALVTSTLISRGLENLIHGSSPSHRKAKSKHLLLYANQNLSGKTGNMVSSSPWTASMGIMLRSLLNNTSGTEADPYFIVLRRRLDSAGESLLTKISNGIGKNTGPSLTENIDGVEGDQYHHRIVYYRGDNYAGLLYICDAST